ncbi:hypothetical protein CS0771_00310 [Catellatospora sp. IY07-71]|uniref:matrixin family metalloprotease n=1 Tax=Catellatospora sp. IY07-71 TaxID=2728827 RepID=UPI001BB35422|nr:matrixin family metalloprotease [Catellatospora sp. IY07-71]BCJ70487.1 hypothetical protein CS0771_00310 [Catellatospora sp. IY07-71]
MFAASASVLGVQSPAQAGNWGSTACGGTPVNCVSTANNRTHAIRYVDFGFRPGYEDADAHVPGAASETNWVISSVYNPTVLSVYRDEADAYPDVWMYDANYGYLSGVTGWVECPPDNTGTGGSHPNRWCRGQRLRLNSYFYWYDSGVYDTIDQRRNVICHEMGHTLGLRHRTDTRASCMWTYAGDGGGSTLDAHDTGHITARYGS